MSEYIVELDSKRSIALGLAFAEEMRGGDFVRGEIVRCRDCKHYNAKLTDEDDGTSWCCIHAGYAFEDDFCSWGERNA